MQFESQREPEDLFAHSHSGIEEREILSKEVPQEENDEDEMPMALIVEDELICQQNVKNELQNMKFRFKTATTVTEAINCYLELEKLGISIDIVFLDILLKDKSTGIDFLKMIRNNKWMERTHIIVMSGIDDMEIVKECYKYNIQNFLQKPITKVNFTQEKVKIFQYIEQNKCPIPGYKKEKQIGAGANGVVYLVRHKKTKEYFAMKEVNIPLQAKKIEQLDEVKYLKNLKAPIIIGLKEYRIINNKLYIILEYAEYGTLNMRIKKKRNENSTFTTEEILDWMTELFIGLFLIHNKGIMHRDIKSDNIFISKNDVIKIGDLGVAKCANNAQTVCGTAIYMPPEMFSYQTYTCSIDIWAAGVVLYELVTLKNPFEGYNSDEIKNKILAGSYEIFPEATDPKIKRLLKMTLNHAPKRASVNDILRLSFIREIVDKLFKTKFHDEDLYKMISEIDILPANERLPFEDVTDKKSYDYFKCFKIAQILNTKIPKTTYHTSIFSFEVIDVIEEYYIKNPDEELQITSKDIEELSKLGLLVKLQGKKDKTYYKIQLKEKDYIDNTINVPLDTVLLTTELEDPVALSIDILQRVGDLWNDLKGIYYHENENEQQMYEFQYCQKLFEFFLAIKKLTYLKMTKYNSKQKLAIILNVYQTMYYHYMLKMLLYEENYTKMGIIRNILSLFCASNNNIDIIYQIGEHVLSIYEMKHIVIRRNQYAPNTFFRAAYASDSRINMIDLPSQLPLETMIKLHCICIDAPNMYDSEGPIIIEPEITKFKEEKLDEDMEVHAIKFLQANISIVESVVNIPSFFKTYAKDFQISEEDLLKSLLIDFYSEKTQKKKIYKMALIKINLGTLTINYYRRLQKS